MTVLLSFPGKNAMFDEFASEPLWLSAGLDAGVLTVLPDPGRRLPGALP